MINSIPIQRTTVNMATGAEKTETVAVPLVTQVRPGCCTACGLKHAPDEPHNLRSMVYQYTFYVEHGRWPTWSDALAHCSDALRQFWITELTARGEMAGGENGLITQEQQA
ncbi:hypothetical protein KGP26_29715 (plasmid) [Serratia sp. JSRIV002]|uniref:hypothetical protein n=1 Tax=Serratia sp. JSRIV002 TaxID=2831894 RepID=UPI001CBF788A|nr:hypothetical protein [Serratia sp. JSRIV002]UAN54729.1 hypothetical protein KGP26_29715 [Serratia sp. JSRIV002]